MNELVHWAIDPITDFEPPLHPDWRPILANILEQPSDRLRKQVGADWFEDQSLASIAAALRWCAHRRKFPYSKRPVPFRDYGRRFQLAYAHRPDRIRDFHEQTQDFYQPREPVVTKWTFDLSGSRAADRLDWSPFRNLRWGIIRVIPAAPTRNQTLGFRMYKLLDDDLRNTPDFELIPVLQALLDLGEALV